MSGKLPVASGTPFQSVLFNWETAGISIGVLMVLFLFIGIFVQYASLLKGGFSGSTEIKDQVGIAFAYFIPTLVIALLGWWMYSYYSSSVNKAGIVWCMGIMAIIFSNIALVTSLFQVRVVSQYI